MSTDALTAVWPDGVDRVLLPSTDSTMAEAARRAPSLTRPTWIMAEMQTAARGRRGKHWSQPPGNFAATLIYRPDCPPGMAALRSFVAANALHTALSTHVAPSRLAMKWPNDVLLDGGKIAGILLEASGAGVRIDWLAVGVGVNLAAAPPPDPGAAFAPVALREACGASVTPEDFLTQLAAAFLREEARIATQGFGPIRRDWLAHAARLGAQITARTAREELAGIFETVDEDGQLVLKTPTGLRSVPAADVYF